MSLDAARTARELQMLEGMVDCAHGLGMAFGAATTAETDTKRSLELLDAFQKCFLGVRMGIRLSMTLRAAPKAAPVSAPALAAERAEALEREPAEHEALERSDSLERERERERDYEPVSLPKFLATLGVVARDAARLDDRLPAGVATDVLPKLHGLLAQATADPRAPQQAAGVAVIARPPQGGTRHKLLGSAATSLPAPGARGPVPCSGSG